MSRVIESMIMPGGFHFLQKMPDGRDVQVDSPDMTYPNLIKAVLDFRLQNHIHVGAVEQEIEAQICSRFPRQCRSIPGPMTSYLQAAVGALSGSPKFVDLISEWAVKIKGNPAIANLETQGEATRRAEICLQCPNNQEWQADCPRCVDNARNMLTILRQGKDLLPLKNKLNGCKAMNHCNRTAIWLKKDVLVPTNNLPEKCWVK